MVVLHFLLVFGEKKQEVGVQWDMVERGIFSTQRPVNHGASWTEQLCSLKQKLQFMNESMKGIRFKDKVTQRMNELLCARQLR